MKTIKFIAASAIAIYAGASFGHEGHEATHARPTSASTPAAKEQTPWGIVGDARAVRRTITLRMTDDMRFAPKHIEVREGETVRLRAENRGQVLHEIVLGTQGSLADHADMMKKHPGMAHDEPHMAHVRAGRSGDVVWTFNRPGRFDFACLIPGHYEAGMAGTITVLPRSKP